MFPFFERIDVIEVSANGILRCRMNRIIALTLWCIYGRERHH